MRRPIPARHRRPPISRLRRLLERGTHEHYQDPRLYDHDYRRRREDVRFYTRLCRSVHAPVLELGAGSGRITLPLARQGTPVVALDLSRPMLDRAAERLTWAGRRLKAPVSLIRADMRAVPCADATFELVLCPFNAFMHLYHPHEIAACLDEVRRLLVPGTGRFVFDILNPDLRWLTRDPRRRWARTRFKHPVTGLRYEYTTNHTYDARRQICLVNLYYDCLDDPTQSVHQLVAHRQFFPQEIRSLLRHHGLELVAEYGDFQGGPFEGDSEQQVLVCRRAPGGGRWGRRPTTRPKAGSR